MQSGAKLKSIGGQFLKLKSIAVTVIGTVLVFGIAVAADPAFKNVITSHPAWAVYVTVVFHLLASIDRALGGSPPPVG